MKTIMLMISMQMMRQAPKGNHQVGSRVASEERDEGIELSRLVAVDQGMQEVVPDQVEERGIEVPDLDGRSRATKDGGEVAGV